MNFKRNLAKISAATAFALAGVATVNTLNAPTSVHAATLPYAVKINYVPGYGIAVWNNYNNPELIAGKKLAHGTAWRVLAQATDANGEVWYSLGSAQWIKAKSTVDASSSDSSTSKVSQPRVSVATVNYVPGYGIAVWNNYNNPELTGKILPHGSSWRVFAEATDSNGELWYNLGGAQWIMAKYTLGGSSNTSSSSNVSASSNNGSSSSASNTTQATTSSAAKVVSLASAQLGKAYVWGGNGPSAFDCSGLVNYVYSQVGISLGRTTYVQVNHGTTVSMNNLQPGDLLFWGSASAPYHVGIYVGNGQYIHAATPSQGVIKQSISQYFYPSVAKRVL